LTAWYELYRLAPGVLDALQLLKPETVIRWHRAGFRAYWRWKSRRRGGRRMAANSPNWQTNNKQSSCVASIVLECCTAI
jgi:hypothetical protein